jgi:hypothetical protein
MGLQDAQENKFSDLFEICEEVDNDDKTVELAASRSGAAAAAVMAFSIRDDSDEEMDEEDMDDYDFDEAALIEMVKLGADTEKLSMTIQDAMAATFERKLHAKASLATFQPVNADDYDVGGFMTPPISPTAGAPASPDEVAAGKSNDAAAVEGRLSKRGGCRRSSLGARKGATDSVSLAAEEVVARHRRSVAAKAASIDANEENVAELQQAMAEACGRRRLSLAKAADVLESAGFAEGGRSQEETAKQLSIVTDAIEDAFKKHRKSIVKAITSIEEGTPPATPVKPETASSESPVKPSTASSLSPSPSKFNPNASTFLSAKASTYTPSASAAAAAAEVQAAADPWAEQMQARMNRVVSSAYDQYNTYYEGYGNTYSDQYDPYAGQGYAEQSYDGYQQPQHWQNGYDSSGTGCYNQGGGWGNTVDTYHQGYGQALASYQGGYGQQQQQQQHSGAAAWGANNSWFSGAW